MSTHIKQLPILRLVPLKRSSISLWGIIFLLMSCQSVQKKVTDAEGSLGRNEIRSVSSQFASEIAHYFISNPSDQGIYLALLPTKNDTTRELPVDVLDFSLVKELLKKKIYTVRTEDRNKALDEIELQLSGLAESDINIGQMKTPNYFIKMKIKESYVRQNKSSIIEYTILMEMRSVENQVVVASDIYEFTKVLEKKSRRLSW